MPTTDNGFLLGNETARVIYREIKDLPVIDIHTHVDLKRVLKNHVEPDPWTALCDGDHYVSSIIESLGAMNRKEMFDPATDPYEKWCAYARVFPNLLGNQVRDWMKLTLESLGVDVPLNSSNAKAVWDRLSAVLESDDRKPVALFKNSNIVLIATTDSPEDSLAEHKQAAKIFGEGYWVPTWRPDRLFSLCPSRIDPKRWVDRVGDLEKAVNKSLLGNFEAFCSTLSDRHDYFGKMGGRASDYGMKIPYGHKVSKVRAEEVFVRASSGKDVDDGEAADFQSYMLRFSMGMDREKGWISQIHYGPARNVRDIAAELGGLDSGCDTVDGYPGVVDSLRDLLNHFDGSGARRHKIVLYSLSKADWERIAGLSRVFPSVYSGSAWWYHDSVSGMLEFLRAVPDVGAGFLKIAPFVTDARNIYSLEPRNQVYRRCLSTVLGELVEFRRDPIEEAASLAKYLCCDHARILLTR